MTDQFQIGGVEIGPGQRVSVDLPLARLYTHTQMPLPVEVLRGSEDGPTLFLTAALHGDEINGTEIIRRVLDQLDPAGTLSGTVVAVAVVNVFGFILGSRYLPDRRDLNRSFPGSKRGSLASQLAALLVGEVIERCQYGIDFHTAAPPRTNLPQIRANLDDAETARCVRAFGSPVAVQGEGPRGSLRRTAARLGVRMLVFEGGEPQRFNPETIKMGTDGTLRVLAELGMIPADAAPAADPPLEVRKTRWIRARRSGIFRLEVASGDRVTKGATLGTVSDPLGSNSVRITSSLDGIVLGHLAVPLVHRGDAVVHVGVVTGD